jgi:EF hand
MRKHFAILLALGSTVTVLSLALAQPPSGRPDDGPGRARPQRKDSSSIVDRMMAFDKNKDGKLTKDEVTDPRLHRLFDQADSNKDGIVTREELIALAKKLEAEEGPGDDRGGPPPGRGPGGPGGPPQPGQILPPFLQDRLNISPEQRKQLEALQKEVDSKLARILTPEQKKQLKDMRDRFGPPGRGPGDRGPGGPPDRRPGDKGPDKGPPPDRG